MKVVRDRFGIPIKWDIVQTKTAGGEDCFQLTRNGKHLHWDFTKNKTKFLQVCAEYQCPISVINDFINSENEE